MYWIIHTPPPLLTHSLTVSLTIWTPFLCKTWSLLWTMQASTSLLNLKLWVSPGKLSHFNIINLTNCLIICQRHAHSLSCAIFTRLQPIEEAFSAIKSWIQANCDYAYGELSCEITCNPYQMIWDAIFITVTPDKAEGWFHHCGYLV